VSPGIVVFGANSLVGSDFVVEATPRFPITAAGRTDPRTRGLPVRRFQALDLSGEAEVRAFLASRADDEAWVNFAARTDVDGCEAERPQDSVDTALVDRPDTAWRINAALPGWISEEAHRKGVPFLHISSDFVFDGSRGPYPEEADPSPLSRRLSWYGYTKGAGEDRVRSAGGPFAILRISYPYRTAFPSSTDFARNLLDRAQTGRLNPLYSDQVVTPTWIPDVSRALLTLLDTHATGVFHVASPAPTTPLEFAEELFRVFRVGSGPLPRTKLAEQPLGPHVTPRPLYGGLGVRRLVEMGVVPTGWRDGILRMAAAQESPH
jgi:dTDP-4-dehydrorhamnose reductase